MATWTLAPSMEAPPSISFSGPLTLITRLDDGTEIVRVKHLNAPQQWTETYRLTGAEFDAALAIFEAYGTADILTKFSYDLYSAPTTEASVRFVSFDVTREGENFFELVVTWRKAFE